MSILIKVKGENLDDLFVDGQTWCERWPKENHEGGVSVP